MIADSRATCFEDLAKARRSIRHFQPASVSRSLIAEILRTAVWAPSPHNVQPWRFTVLQQLDDKARLAEAMASRLADDLRLDGLEHEAISRQTARSRQRLLTAPVIMVCSLVRDGLVTYRDEQRSSLEWAMAVQSVGTVLQTICLAAEAHGLGTCWMAAPMYCPHEVRTALELPDEFAPQALVLMGYAAAPGKIRDRLPFTEIVEFR